MARVIIKPIRIFRYARNLNKNVKGRKMLGTRIFQKFFFYPMKKKKAQVIMEELHDWCSNVSPMWMLASLPVEIFHSQTRTKKKKHIESQYICIFSLARDHREVRLTKRSEFNKEIFNNTLENHLHELKCNYLPGYTNYDHCLCDSAQSMKRDFIIFVYTSRVYRICLYYRSISTLLYTVVVVVVRNTIIIAKVLSF